jgi:hypothetical protein
MLEVIVWIRLACLLLASRIQVPTVIGMTYWRRPQTLNERDQNAWLRSQGMWLSREQRKTGSWGLVGRRRRPRRGDHDLGLAVVHGSTARDKGAPLPFANFLRAFGIWRASGRLTVERRRGLIGRCRRWRRGEDERGLWLTGPTIRWRNEKAQSPDGHVLWSGLLNGVF